MLIEVLGDTVRSKHFECLNINGLQLQTFPTRIFNTYSHFTSNFTWPTQRQTLTKSLLMCVNSGLLTSSGTEWTNTVNCHHNKHVYGIFYWNCYEQSHASLKRCVSSHSNHLGNNGSEQKQEQHQFCLDCNYVLADDAYCKYQGRYLLLLCCLHKMLIRDSRGF